MGTEIPYPDECLRQPTGRQDTKQDPVTIRFHAPWTQRDVNRATVIRDLARSYPPHAQCLPAGQSIRKVAQEFGNVMA